MSVNLINEEALTAYFSSIVYNGNRVEPIEINRCPDRLFVRSHKDALVRAMVMEWFNHHMRAFLTHRQKSPFFTPVALDDDLPAWAQKALKQGNPIYRFDPVRLSQKLKKTMVDIRDFLYGAAEIYVTKTLDRASHTHQAPKFRMDYLKTSHEWDSFKKVLKAAIKWHAATAMEEDAKQKDVRLYQKSLKGTIPVWAGKDGMEIYQLTTPESLDFESQYMHHCVGEGLYDEGVETNTSPIYSLRDADGVPHVTMQAFGKELIQCKGRGNRPPVSKYVPYLLDFIKEKGFTVASELKNFGLIKQNGSYYNVWDLPDGFVIDGDLDLSEMGLSHLPNLSHVTVRGNFYCAFNQLTDLKGAPQTVGKNFYCFENQLETLRGCSQTVGGDFICSVNRLTGLTGGPQTVGGHFDCSHNELTDLKDGPLVVAKDYDCSHNHIAVLTGIPQNVRGDVDCSYNRLFSLKDAPQSIGGDFKCPWNLLQDLRHAPAIVLGNFDCSHNQIMDLSTLGHVGQLFDCTDNVITGKNTAARRAVLNARSRQEHSL